MFNRDRWSEIFESISNNKLRTALSGFTITLGIFIFIVLFGFGNGLKNGFQEFFLDDSTNTLWVFPGRTTKPYKGFATNRTIEFRNDDLDDMEKNFPMFIEYITPRIARSGLTSYKGESNTYSTRAVSPGHQFSEKTIIMKGRYINEMDLQNKARHVVIGRLVEQDLFKNENALGKFVDINGINYKVVGVFQDDGGDNEERMIYLPYTARQLIEKNTDKIDFFIIGFRENMNYTASAAFARSVEKFLRDKHTIHPDDQNGMFVRNAAEGVKQTEQLAGVLQMAVAFVAAGTLFAGIIGILTIMIFVVKERTKELGIRKALGASPNSVIGMVLQESIFITLIAGIFGMVLGIAVLSSIGLSLQDYFIKYPYVATKTIVMAVVSLIVCGAIAGYIPARRAARIKPIVALRDE